MINAVVDGSGFTGTVVSSYASGGVVISHGIKPAGAPFAGTWARTGEHEFRATSWSGFGGPQGARTSLRVAQGRLHQDGTISGSFTQTEFDGVTDEPVAVITGSFTGTRIVA